MEALLGRAGVTLEPKEKFNTGGESGTDFDPEAYGQALFSQLTNLSDALNASAIDQIAASLKILPIARAPIGSGPYRFVAYKAGQSVELARFDDYFGGPTGADPADLPARVFVNVVKDATAGVAALQKGDTLWVPKIEAFDAYNSIKDDPGLKFANYPDNGYYFIAFNLREGKLYSDRNLRVAFTMCIDHEATIKAATSDNGAPVRANTPPFSWAYDPTVPTYELDVDGAKALIESSGWTLGGDGVYAKDGQRLSTKLYVRAGRPQRVAFARLAKDQLRKCGIEIEVVEADLTTVLIPNVLDYPNKFDTYLGGWNTGLDPDDYSIFHSSEIPTAENPSANNFPGWVNADADRLLEEGRTTLDQARRTEIYAEFQKLIHEEAPYYFLWADLAHGGISGRVSSSTGEIDLSSVAYFWNQDAWTVAQK
jgi:peptide/nickel transport system substrate-binding protein